VDISFSRLVAVATPSSSEDNVERAQIVYDMVRVSTAPRIFENLLKMAAQPLICCGPTFADENQLGTDCGAMVRFTKP
jgi:CO dehydrogenase/acetyl-CoA synthase epsilon subunit